MNFDFFKFRTIVVTFFTIFLTFSAKAEEIIRIGATPVPQADILKQIKPILKTQGIDLQIKEFNDYTQLNLLVQQKQLDANFFQHTPYLNEFNQSHKTNLVPLVEIEIEPIGLYVSQSSDLVTFAKSKNLNKLPKTVLSIGIPNDTTNEARSLLFLQKNGLIKLTNKNVIYPTKKDIVSNFYHLKIIELDPAMLPRALLSKQIDLAVINSNYALDANMDPLKDAIFIESIKSPYINVIVVRPDDVNTEKMKKLIKEIRSQKIKNYIKTKYKGAVIAVTK